MDDKMGNTKEMSGPLAEGYKDMAAAHKEMAEITFDATCEGALSASNGQCVNLETKYDKIADAIYITLSDAPYVYGKDLDDERRVDYD